MADQELEYTKRLADGERPVDTAAGLRRFRETVGARGVAPYRSSARRHWLQGVAAAAAAVALFAGLTVTGVAESFFTIFQPKQVAPLVIGTDAIGGLSDLRDYGTIEITTQPVPRQVATLEEAQSQTGITPLRATSLPVDVTGDARIYTVSKGEGTFRFDEAKLAQSADRASRTPPPMPARIAASTLHVSGGPAVVQSYGASFDPDPSALRAGGEVPTLLIAQSKAPVVRSDGATVEELRSFLLDQPGITGELAAQINAIGDLSETLLVPIPIDFASGKEVTVRGTRGVFVGDSTGIGSAVVWIADGTVHMVAGALGEDALLRVANSLR